MGTLRVEGVSYRYGPESGGVLALRDLSFTVQAGTFVSIVGPSGCGKTTFLNLLAGVYRPLTGQIYVDDQRLTGPDRSRAMVFQQPCLLPWRNTFHNVLYGIECQGRQTQPYLESARELIELVGLRGFEQHFPHQLSGGMQQRANLARALLADPQILLMDEPFAALDAQTREVMQMELLRIWAERRKTVVFITHQIDEALYLSDRVIVLGSRPGTIKAALTVELPRPRQLALKRTAQFLALYDHIWKLIEGDVIRAAQGLDEPKAG